MQKKEGFKIPNYEVISNNVHLKNANVKYQQLVSKSISNGIYKVIESNRFYSYTELIDDIDVNFEKNVNFFPSLVMSLVEKKMEVRVFYLDGHFFSMIIFSQKDKQTSVDFRKYNLDKPNKLQSYILPKHVASKLKRVFEKEELNTGSADLIINKDGEFVFLEINPVGQYGMVSRPCNYNLDKKIAKYLINGKVSINGSWSFNFHSFQKKR